jgi:isopentenyl diphosphate isomerase/L-lactate dehydrogenase-like FMN-dependent dehydrogenase
VQWPREQWDGPFMVMGITRVDDARRAADIGATAVSVSHHGGSNLDSTPATIRVLPAIAEAVGDQVEVVVDGGARREGDVVKAIALGARAVTIGRPICGALPRAGRPASRTCSTSCAAAQTRPFSVSGTARFTS